MRCTIICLIVDIFVLVFVYIANNMHTHDSNGPIYFFLARVCVCVCVCVYVCVCVCAYMQKRDVGLRLANC